MNDILENYELRKKDLTFETWFIEGIQYNFKLEDFEELLGINKENLLIFISKIAEKKKKIIFS